MFGFQSAKNAWLKANGKTPEHEAKDQAEDLVQWMLTGSEEE